MITDKDVEKLITKFATKDDIENLEVRVSQGFTDLQKQINNLDKKFVTKDEFITFEDHILGEIRTLFQENLVKSAHRRELDDHERRITKLEKIAFSN